MNLLKYRDSHQHPPRLSDSVVLDHVRLQEMTARPVFDLDDPHIGIEADFACEARLDLVLGHRLDAEAAAESAIGRISIVEGALRRWREQFRGAVEPVQLDEDSAGLFGPAPPYRGKGPLDVAAANIGRHPDRGFKAHEGDYLDCRMSCS